jgi:hypothetical protein
MIVESELYSGVDKVGRSVICSELASHHARDLAMRSRNTFIELFCRRITVAFVPAGCLMHIIMGPFSTCHFEPASP